MERDMIASLHKYEDKVNVYICIRLGLCYYLYDEILKRGISAQSTQMLVSSDNENQIFLVETKQIIVILELGSVISIINDIISA